MKGFDLSPQALQDVLEIWNFLANRASEATADYVEERLFKKFAALARRPGTGHSRPDLTDEAVLFTPVYSYLIVYRPATRPLQICGLPS
jgi:antitoxin ParD1/3/4/toxin ParE1/3/4